MKRWLIWALVALVLGLLGLGVQRALSARKAQQEAVAKMATQRVQTVVELGASDVVEARSRDLAQVLAISGALKAVNSAIVKARVPGELQGLSVREGDAVKAGQIIAQVDPFEYKARVRQAQQMAESAKAQVDIARRNFDNNRSLVDQGFISKTALDTSISTLAAAEASFRAAQAGVEVANQSLSDTVLRAPLSGLVSQRLAQPGERVVPDARIIEIVDLSRLELEAGLSTFEAMGLRLGQSAALQIEGLAKPVTARVVRINPSAVAGSRALTAYLSIDGVPGLHPGMFVQGALNTGRLQSLAVPLSAVRTDKPQPYVQVVDQDRIRHQTIELGARGELDGQTLVAIKGLSENTRVVAGSIGPLRDGTTVKFSTAPAAAASGK